MTEHVPARRGRPPKAEAVAPAVEPIAPATGEKPPARRRRSSVGGHAMKLSAPPRPGFVRRFVNDSGNRLAELEELGYTLVDEPGIQTHDPSSRINRLAGTQASGAPLKTYLMETPEELYAQGVAEKEAENASREARDRQDFTGQPGSYNPDGRGSN